MRKLGEEKTAENNNLALSTYGEKFFFRKNA